MSQHECQCESCTRGMVVEYCLKCGNAIVLCKCKITESANEKDCYGIKNKRR